jgi:hypothetical protein
MASGKGCVGLMQRDGLPPKVLLIKLPFRYQGFHY